MSQLHHSVPKVQLITCRLSAEIIDEHTYKEFENISDHFGKNVTDFYKLLKDLSKTSNSTHLFHLTQRM
jgi:hypothetical protein